MDQEQQQNTNQQFTTPDTNQTPPQPAEPPKAGKKGRGNSDYRWRVGDFRDYRFCYHELGQKQRRC